MPTNAGDIIRVACRFRWSSVDEMINVHYFTVQDETAPPNDAELLLDLSEVLSDAYTNVQGRISDQVSADDITVYNITDDYPLGVVNWTAPFGGGMGAGDALPPGTAAIVLWRTATKRVLGKTFLPVFSESQQSAGLLTNAAQSDMEDFAAAMANVLTGTFGYGFLKGIWSESAGEMRPIVSQRAAQRIGYQRRRKAGVGS